MRKELKCSFFNAKLCRIDFYMKAPIFDRRRYLRTFAVPLFSFYSFKSPDRLAKSNQAENITRLFVCENEVLDGFIIMGRVGRANLTPYLALAKDKYQ